MTVEKTYDDVSLYPASILASGLSAYSAGRRIWQGIPGICWAGGERLFATWYSGGKTEGPDNYVVVAQSDNLGRTWRDPVLVVVPEGNVRAFDPTLWRSPDGRVWLFWAQGWSPRDIEIWDGRAGVWCSVCNNPLACELTWSVPMRISDGVMMNKPCVAKNGDWLFPVAIWNRQPFHPDTIARRSAGIVVSRDNGKTFVWLGGAKMPDDAFNEHVIFERNDEYVIWSRTRKGMAESTSVDGGKTWSDGHLNGLDCPNSRFNISRLPGRELLLVNHVNPDLNRTTYIEVFSGQCWPGRNRLTAMLSADDGRTWFASFMFDDRQGVSYPDIDLMSDGTILIVYDYDRFGKAEIELLVMTRDDIVNSRSSEMFTISRLR